MGIDRRRVLRALAGLGLAAAWPGAQAQTGGAAQAQAPAGGAPDAQGGSASHAQNGGEWHPPGVRAPGLRYVSGRRSAAGHQAVLVDAQGVDQRVVPLTDRAHGAAFDPATGRIVVFGRQPGFFALAFDLQGSEPAHLPLLEGRHFFGHGVFVQGGRLLLATENDYAAGRGVLGVYDASPGAAYRRVGEFLTGGVGPHEVIALPGTPYVVVANGGILTHPDYDKTPLNLATMQPSLAYIDTRSGEVIERVTLPAQWHQLSIRHLALDAANRVWFGCQHMGPANELPPLVGCHRRGQAPVLVDLPDEGWRPYRNYIGSVAADAAGRVIAVSSPLGQRIGYLETGERGWLGETALSDGCGLAPAAEPGRFLVSSGLGHLGYAGPVADSLALREDASLAWDNHMQRLVSA